MSTLLRAIGGIGYILLAITQIVGIVTMTSMSRALMLPQGMQPLLMLSSTSTVALVLSLIGIILIGIAWIILGRYVKSGVMIATGILFLIVSILQIVVWKYTIYVQHTIALRRALFPTATYSFGALATLMTLSLALAALFFVTLILHIISHFTAGSRTGVKLFKVAGILHIIAIIAAIVGFSATFYYMFTSAAHYLTPSQTIIMHYMYTFISVVIVVYSITLIAFILSATSFLVLKARESFPTRAY